MSEEQPTESADTHPSDSAAGDSVAGPTTGDGVPAENAPEERSVTDLRRPSTAGGIIYLCVLAVALFGVGLAATGAWRAGVTWLAGALLAAAAARVVLRTEDAGMLEVRRKWVDAGILTFLGAALIFLAVTIPDQPV